MIPATLAEAVQRLVTERERKSIRISASRTARGGSINSAVHLECSNGMHLFLKYNDEAPADMFQKEARGLQLLASANSIRVPAVYYTTPADAPQQFLLLEDVLAQGPERSSKSAFMSLGAGLAGVHRMTSHLYGLDQHNYLGPTRQPNNVSDNWASFFVEHRLQYILDLMAERGCDQTELTVFRDFVPAVQELLDERIPEPPSLVHGDLWGGNVLHTRSREPVLIDPALYYGDREVDIAMTRLFGGFSNEFYADYEAAYPLTEGWRERQDVYNLYHLLHHALLFGGGYLTQASNIVKRYSRRT
ncbi:MAG: fructosamine kinase family protein [Candidatus Sumerlaeaceae bacterium]